jgi:hypothetical protein
MNRIDLIKLVGDAITEIDVLLGSNIPDNTRNTLEFQRNTLDSVQLLLVKNQFNDNTSLYLQATKELKDVNDTVKTTLNDISKIIETMGNITRLVNSVTTVLKVIGLIF